METLPNNLYFYRRFLRFHPHLEKLQRSLHNPGLSFRRDGVEHFGENTGKSQEFSGNVASVIQGQNCVL